MFNRLIRPRYLEHELAVIEGLDDRTVIVRLWRPVGRFGSGQLRCPPLALQRVDLAAAPRAGVTPARPGPRRRRGPPACHQSGGSSPCACRYSSVRVAVSH
jgi:hypothetical protein